MLPVPTSGERAALMAHKRRAAAASVAFSQLQLHLLSDPASRLPVGNLPRLWMAKARAGTLDDYMNDYWGRSAQQPREGNAQRLEAMDFFARAYATASAPQR